MDNNRDVTRYLGRTSSWQYHWMRRSLAGVLVAATLALLLRAGAGGPAEAAGASIAELIADAAPGETVVVPSGVYREQVVVDKPLTLIGEDWPVIDAGGAGDVVLVTAPDVTLRGFVVQGSARDVTGEPAGVRVRADRAIVEGNRVRDTLYGIVLEDSSGHRVADNAVSSIAEFGPERRGHALYLWHTDGNYIGQNIVEGAKDGIFLGFATNTRVEGNHVTGARYGIHYMYAHHNTFFDNVFRHNIAGGAIMFSRDITFRGNEFAYNDSRASGHGLLFKDVDDVEMSGNLVHHNRVGMKLEGAPQTPGAFVTLQGNFVGHNEIGLELASTTSTTFTENTFIGNLDQLRTSGGSLAGHNTWEHDGRGNYWDEYAGYDADGDGVGDIPYTYDDVFSELVRREEAVRAYSFTPAREALDLAAGWFPAFRPAPSLIDTSPLVSPTVRLEADGSTHARLAGILLALGLVVPPLLLLWSGRKLRGAPW